MRLAIFIILCTLVVGCYAASIEQLAQLYENNQLEKLQTQLLQADAAARRHPHYLFFTALVEKNAAIAVEKYKAFLAASPNSEFADDAVFRIAMFHYAQESDSTARMLLHGMVKAFPQSTLKPDAEYLIAQTFLNESLTDSAVVAMQSFLQKNPRSQHVDLAVNDLEALGGVSLSDLQTNSAVTTCYTIQIGTFQNYDVTDRVAARLRAKFKYVTIYPDDRNHSGYFALCIGQFNALENAHNYAEKYIKPIIADCQVISCAEFE